MARGTLVPSRSEGKRDASEEQPENDEDEESDRARLASVSKRERTESLAVPYKVGQHIDVLDSVDRWAEAKVTVYIHPYPDPSRPCRLILSRVDTKNRPRQQARIRHLSLLVLPLRHVG